MLYRIRLNAHFPEEPPPEWFNGLLAHFLQHAININPGQSNEEIGFLTLEQCYHDEDPTRPCEIIEHHTCPNNPP